MANNPNGGGLVGSIWGAASGLLKLLYQPLKREFARRGAEYTRDVTLADIDPLLSEAFDVLGVTPEDLPNSAVQAGKAWLSERPQIFDKFAAREWASDARVQAAVKAIVFAELRGDEASPEHQATIAAKYSECTGEHNVAASQASEQLLTFVRLSINRHPSPAETILLAQTRAATQSVKTEIRTASAEIVGVIGSQVRLLTEQNANPAWPSEPADQRARDQLQRALRRRNFHGADYAAELGNLLADVTTGHLRAASPAVKAEITTRSSRLAAVAKDIEHATTLLERTKQLNPERHFFVEEAWITAAQGDTANALATLLLHKDPETRAAILGILREYKSNSALIAWVRNEALTPQDFSAHGLVLLANAFLSEHQWSSAYEYAARASLQQRLEAPILHALHGLSAMLLAAPQEMREPLHSDPLPLFHLENMRFLDGSKPAELLGEAREQFALATAAASDLGATQPAALYDDIALWLAFQDPSQVPSARALVQESMQDDALVFRRLRFALSYGIDFNRDAMRRALERREELGALNIEVMSAMLALLLDEARDEPKKAADFITARRQQLLQYFTPTALASIQIELLTRSGQVSAARALLEDARPTLDPPAINRLDAQIAEAGGADMITTRTSLYATSKSLPDLELLIEALVRHKEWNQLLPYALNLFARQPTVRAAMLVCNCCHESNNQQTLSEFLAGVGSLADISLDLLSEVAWDHFRNGHYQAARSAVEKLQASRDHPNDRALSMNIAIDSGDWDRLQAIVEQNWLIKDSLAAHELILSARLAYIVGNDRCTDFSERAVEKAPTSPDILLNAWMIAHQTGQLSTRPHMRKWFEDAVRLSGPEGPIRAVALKEMAALQPGWDEETRRVSEGVNSASTPLFAAALRLRMPLTHLVISRALQNFDQSDPRRLAPIHCFHGSRQPVALASSSSLGLDLTAILVLSYVGLLERVVSSFTKIIIPAGTLAQLFADRQRVQFHQPSLVQDAERLQSLISGSESIRSLENPASPDSQLVDEVGHELAELVATARRDGGAVVQTAPVYKVASFMEVEADIAAHATTITDTHTLLARLSELAAVDSGTAASARAFLRVHDRGWPTPASIPPNTPIYLTDLTVSYLFTTGLIDRLPLLRAPIFVSRQATQHMRELIRYSQFSGTVLRSIDEIRRVLAKAIQAGKVIVGPRRTDLEDMEETRYHPTLTLPLLVEMADACVIDDRALNRSTFWTLKSGNPKPIATTLDLIDQLATTQSEALAARHKLRASGFIHIPPTQDELISRISHASIANGKLQETTELKTIRQTLDRTLMQQALHFPTEFALLDRLRAEVIMAIRRAWSEGAPHEHLTVRADWLMRLLPDPRMWTQEESNNNLAQVTRHQFALQVASLAMPLFGVTQERREAYAEWIERRLIAPLRQIEPHTLQLAGDQLKALLNSVLSQDGGNEDA